MYTGSAGLNLVSMTSLKSDVGVWAGPCVDQTSLLLCDWVAMGPVFLHYGNYH